jgi:hypothetical protein
MLEAGVDVVGHEGFHFGGAEGVQVELAVDDHLKNFATILPYQASRIPHQTAGTPVREVLI